jgi:nitrate reductase beta subunit
VLLYDADRIGEYAATKNDKDLYGKQLDLILDPCDPEVVRQAQEQHIPHSFIEAAQQSPVYKMMVKWKIAFPLHPEYRTLPMVWYVPPMSPIRQEDNATEHFFGTADEMRIPVDYIARLMTAGDETLVRTALGRLLAMRQYMRERTVEKEANPAIPADLGLESADYEEMYRYLAIADYRDRFVIPTAPTHSEDVDLAGLRAGLGFDYPGKADEGRNLFGGR